MSDISYRGAELHRSARLEEQNIQLKNQLGHFIEEVKIQDSLISEVINMLAPKISKNLYETPEEKLLKDIYMKLGGHKAKAIEMFNSGMTKISFENDELKFEHISVKDVFK